MKKHLIVLFISLSTVVQAQISCYVIGGTSNGIDLSASSQPGFNFGALIDMPFSKLWSFQTGLNYNNVALDSKWDVIRSIGGNQDAVFNEGSFSTFNFLEIPACISLKIKLSEKSNLRFNTGAFMGVFTGGIDLLRTSSGFANYALYPSYADPVNLGFLVGAGIDINKIYLGIEGNINATSYIPEGTIKTKLGIKL